MTSPDHARESRRETLFRVCVIAVCTLLTGTAIVVYALEDPITPDNYTNSHTGAPGGHKAFVELLRESGREVRREAVRLTLPEYNDWTGDTLVLLEPRPTFVDDFESELEALLEQAAETHSSVVLVLPKRRYTALREEDGERVLRESIHPLHDAQRLLAMTGLNDVLRVARDLSDNVRAYAGNEECSLHEPVQVLRRLDSAAAWPGNLQEVAVTESGDILAVRLVPDPGRTHGGLIVVSDPDFFSNRFLSEPGVADMAMEMLSFAPPHGAIVIDEKLHGFGADTSIAYLAFTTPGLWVTLSVLLALAVFGWRQGTVLRPQSAELQDRDARLYAIEGLARLMERAGQHGDALRRIVRRSRIVLGQGQVQSHEAGRGAARLPDTGRISITGSTSEDQLVNIARKVAARKRAGESDSAELWS